MFTNPMASNSRIARLLEPSRVLPIALVFVIADLAITAALLGLAVEANPIAAWLFESVGVATTGIVAVGLVTLAYVGLDRDELDTYECGRRLVSGGLLGVLAAPLVWNTAIWVRLGTPRVALAGVVETLAPVALVAVVAVIATSVDMDRVPSPEREEVISVVFSVLMVTSMVGGVAFVGTQPMGEDQGGVVNAQQTDLDGDFSVFYEGFSEADLSKYDIEETTVDNGGTSTADVSLDDQDYVVGGHAPRFEADVSSGDNAKAGIKTIDTIPIEPGTSFTMNSQMKYSWGFTNTNRIAIRISDGDEYVEWGYEGGNNGDGWNIRGTIVDNFGEHETSDSGSFDWTNVEFEMDHQENKARLSGDGVDDATTDLSGEFNSEDVTVEIYVYDNSGNISSGTSIGLVDDLELQYISSASDNPIRVTDQNGDPIQNATVEAYRADEDQIAEQVELTAEEAEREAQTLLDDASDVIPDEFDEDLNPVEELQDAEVDGEIPLVHQADDWEMEGRLGAGTAGIDTIPSLGNPEPVHEAGEPLVISIWDMDGGGLIEDDVDSSVDGATSVPEQREVVIEQVAGEDSIDTKTIETQPFVEITALTNLGTKTHHAATTRVPDGFYRVYPEGEPEKATYHSVGDPSQTASLIEQDLRDEADRLTDRAENVQNRIDSGIFETERAVTNESGVPQDFSLPQGQVAIQAYKGPDVDLFDDVENPSELSISDIRELGTAYDGAIYLPATPERIDTRDLDEGEDIEITLQKVDTDPFSGMDEYEDRLEDRLNELLNESTSELESVFNDLVGVEDFEDLAPEELEDRFDELETRLVNNDDLDERFDRLRDDLESVEDIEDIEQIADEELQTMLEDMERSIQEERSEELEDLIEQNTDLEERVEDLVGDIEDSENATNEQLEEQLAAMEQAIADVEEGLSTGDPNFDIDDEGFLSGELPFGAPINEDATSVILHFEDGTSQVVSEEYWTVQSGGLFDDGDTVTLDEYDIPDDRAVADVDVNAVSEAGDLGSGSGSATNPAFEGDIPDIDAIDVGTLRPGVGESVGVQVRSDDDAFETTEAVQVFGPSGDQLNVTQEGDRFRWSPSAEGTHTIRTTYSNDIGGEFTETLRLNARDSPATTPPTVRITDGIAGDKAIAGDGLESASFDSDGESATIIAQAPGGESPSQIDIRAEQLRVDTLDVSVVSGENQRSVDRHVSVRVRAQFGGESLVWHPDAPITADGDTVAGEWETREDEDGSSHQVIDTYTDADGTTTIEVNRDPGIIDRIQHRLAVSSPFDIPFLMTTLPAMPSDTAFAVVTAYTPMIDEATPGQIVFGPTDMTAATTGVGV